MLTYVRGVPRWIMSALPAYLIVSCLVGILLPKWIPDLPEAVQHIVNLHGMLCGLLLAALCSGLTVGLLHLNRMSLEAEAANNNEDAAGVLALRKDANFLVCTLIWSNVFAMKMSDIFLQKEMHGLLHGVVSDLVFTILEFGVSIPVITIFGEILPVALLSRYGLALGAPLTPAVRSLQRIAWVVSKPTALLFDWTVGREHLEVFTQLGLSWVINFHAKVSGVLGKIAGAIAGNAIDMEDTTLAEEGQELDVLSVIEVKMKRGKPVLARKPDRGDRMLQAIHRSKRKWVILTNNGKPVFVLDADQYLREVLMHLELDPLPHLHRPLIYSDPRTRISVVLEAMSLEALKHEDGVIDRDVAVLWPESGEVDEHGDAVKPRIITGSDFLERLARGKKVRNEETEGARAAV